MVVEENELPTAWIPVDCFRLQWTKVRVDHSGAGPLVGPLVGMTCAIRYATDGDAGTGGMDRGRLLDAMDRELAAALEEPRHVLKMNYDAVEAASSAGTAAALTTNIFWSDVAFEPVTVEGERLQRMATVEVFGYVEAGDR